MAKTKVKQMLYSRADAAAALGISTATIHRLEKAGKLHPVKLTGPLGATLYRSEEIEALARGEAGK
jgi:predicted site-specific integrase-resolvase